MKVKLLNLKLHYIIISLLTHEIRHHKGTANLFEVYCLS